MILGIYALFEVTTPLYRDHMSKVHSSNGCGNPFFLVYAQFHFLKITVDGCVNLKNMTIYPIRFDNPNFTRGKVRKSG